MRKSFLSVVSQKTRLHPFEIRRFQPSMPLWTWLKVIVFENIIAEYGMTVKETLKND